MHRLRQSAPATTDNFQVRPFAFEGNQFVSCEHAYQALKFTYDTKAWHKLKGLQPRAGENDSTFGMRCWQEGQRGAKDSYRSD